MSTKRDYTKLHLNDLLTLVQNGEKGANLEIKDRFRSKEAQFNDLKSESEYCNDLLDHVNNFVGDWRALTFEE